MLLGSTAILLGALLAAPSYAVDECGTGTSVVCDAGDAGYPTFPTGIFYDPVADLTLVVESGVAVAPTSGDGITIVDSFDVNIVQNNADVAVTLSQGSRIDTIGSAAHGVVISNTAGNISFYGLGAIETIGDQAHAVRLAFNHGDIAIVTSGSIKTHGTRAYGLYLDYNYEGNINIESASTITTYGAYSYAIVVKSPYTTDIAIRHSGTITTSGTNAHGIYIYGADWPSNPPGAPLSITTSAGSTITVAGHNADGIRIIDGGDSITDITLDLAGSIDVQGTGAAIHVIDDAPVTLDNTGAIRGDVILGGGEDSFTNAGTLYTDDIDMGGGDDTLVNNGLIALSSSAGTIANVESFTHSGIIDLANGTAGETLSVSGEFVSAGGALHMDAALASGTADRLTLGTVAATSDPTFIYITGLGSGITPASPILLIDATSDDSAGGAFISAPVGAYVYELTYDPSLANWYLGALGIYPGTAEYPALVSGALLAFASDLSALHQRLRDGFGDGKDRIEPAAWTGPSLGLRPWVELTGARHEIDADASYDSTVTRLRTGLDMAGGTASALYALGGFLGVGQTQQEFAGSASEAEANVVQAGFYGGYRKGAFYGQGLVKYEHHAAELESLSTAYETAPYAVDLLGLSLESGYRIALDRIYLKPRARLSYAHAWAGGFEDASGAAIDLEDADSLSGELAARLGWSSLYVDLALRHEFLGETSAEVSGLTFSDELPGTVVRLASGLDWSFIDGRLNLALDAGYAKGSDSEELTATAALRVNY